MTNIILYETYLKETGDLISIEEWVISESKLKRMGSYWDVMKRYGIIGLASYMSGAKSIEDNATGGLLSVPLSVILYAGYRKTSETCLKRCENTLCKQTCYLRSCSLVIKEIYDSMKEVKSKTKESKKMLAKLDKELIKWVKKYNHHKKIIKEIHDEKTMNTKNRYFGNDDVEHDDDKDINKQF